MKKIFSLLISILSLCSVSAYANHSGLFFNGQMNMTGIKYDGTNHYWQDGTYAATCNAYKTATGVRYKYAGATGSGYYVIQPAGKGTQTIQVWCDMVTDGGGWTMVGRSNSYCPTSFGWQISNGSPSNTGQCYSLSIPNSGLTSFTQILFGNISSGNNWGSYVYRHNVTWGTLNSYQNSPFALGTTPTPISGGDTVFNMAMQMGYTAGSSYYYFRDGGTGATYGLMSTGWVLYYGPGGSDSSHPEWAGYIEAQQGMIMVR